MSSPSVSSSSTSHSTQLPVEDPITPPSTPLSSVDGDQPTQIMSAAEEPSQVMGPPLSPVLEQSVSEVRVSKALESASRCQPITAPERQVAIGSHPDSRSTNGLKLAVHRRCLSETGAPQLVFSDASTFSACSSTSPNSGSRASPALRVGAVSLEPTSLLNAVYTNGAVTSPGSGHRFLIPNSSFSSLSSLVSIGTEFSISEFDGSSVKSFEVDNSSYTRSCASLDRGPSEDSGVASVEDGRGARKKNGPSAGSGSGISSFFGSALMKFAATPKAKGSNGLSRRPSTPSSTTGLILHDRPDGLPAKDPKESKKHAVEYSKVLERIKRDETEQKRRAEDEDSRRLQRELRIRSNLDIWRNEILPNWQRRLLRTDRQRRSLLWDGVPGPLRDHAWPLMVGNELGISREVFARCLRKLQEVRRAAAACNGSPDGEKDSSRCVSCAAACSAALPPTAESSLPSSDPQILKRQQQTLNLICTDIVRTFPKLSFFQADGPQHQDMMSVLGAYAFGFNPDVGYCQGMSFLAAVLLLNLPSPYEAFLCLANLLNRPVLNSLYCGDLGEKFSAYRAVFDHFLMRFLPDLGAHFQEIGLDSRIYLLSWLLTLFSSTLPLECSFRVWDLYLVDGDAFLLRAALGLLRCLQSFLKKQCYDLSAEFLTKMIPDEALCPNKLFQAIRSVPLDYHEFHSLLEEAQEEGPEE